MTYISIANHAKLTGLTREDIVEMIQMSGVYYLDASILTYVSRVDGIEEKIMLDNDTLDILKQDLDFNNFTLGIIGSLIKIESNSIPPSLFFMIDKWDEKLESLGLYSPDFHALIPHRLNGPMFIGEQTVILRLSDDFDGNYDIICLKDLEKG